MFDYPAPRAERIHGPAGYISCESFRPWLRDEFMFRCIYCLKRESWGQATGEFELDHFQPQSIVPQRSLDYLNLVYACRRCNSVKLEQLVDDPCVVLSSDSVVVLPDGRIRSNQPAARKLIQQLDLNSPKLKRWRVMWLRIFELAAKWDAKLYEQLVGFPDDLPNLGRLRPPSNSRPDGIEVSCYAKRQRGQLPTTY
ncbi:MAG: HNH endonuclease [Planctomycetales bacterium]|nr:HNH endonuclease [Planctomycetales bacterium]